MKFFTFLLLSLFGIWSVANAASVCSKSKNQLEIEIISGILPIPEDTQVYLWVLNSATPPKLPIDYKKLTPNSFVEYTTPLQLRTQTPEWKSTFNITADQFNEESYIVFELYRQIWFHFPVQYVYLGGIELTLGHFEQYDKFCNLALLDQNQERVGILALKWTNDNAC